MNICLHMFHRSESSPSRSVFMYMVVYNRLYLKWSFHIQYLGCSRSITNLSPTCVVAWVSYLAVWRLTPYLATNWSGVTVVWQVEYISTFRSKQPLGIFRIPASLDPTEINYEHLTLTLECRACPDASLSYSVLIEENISDICDINPLALMDLLSSCGIPSSLTAMECCSFFKPITVLVPGHVYTCKIYLCTEK